MGGEGAEQRIDPLVQSGCARGAPLTLAAGDAVVDEAEEGRAVGQELRACAASRTGAVPRAALRGSRAADEASFYACVTVGMRLETGRSNWGASMLGDGQRAYWGLGRMGKRLAPVSVGNYRSACEAKNSLSAVCFTSIN
jgi:hypothetical protein